MFKQEEKKLLPKNRTFENKFSFLAGALSKIRIFFNKYLIFIFFGIILLLILFFLNFGITEKFILDVKPEYDSNEFIDGVLKFTLQEGEAIPISTKINLVLGNFSQTYFLSDLISEEVVNQNFSLEGTNLSGIGEAYAVIPSEVYPNVTFTLEIYSVIREGENVSIEPEVIEEGNVSVIEPEVTEEENVSIEPEVIEEENVSIEPEVIEEENVLPSPEIIEEEIPIEEFEVIPPPEAVSEEKVSEKIVEEKKDEKVKVEKVQETEESSVTETPITGAIISGFLKAVNNFFLTMTGQISLELKDTIEGNVSKNNPFIYVLKEGQSAEIKFSSKEVNLNIENDTAIISTDYIGENFKVFEINLTSLKIPVSEGILSMNLSYDNFELISFIQEINILEEIEEEINESNVTLLPEELINATFIEVNLDKENYFLNETINVSGIAIINGSKINDTIKLELFFNESLIFADSINVLNGNYIYSFISDFENDGYYNLKVSYQNISAETTFFYSLVNFTLEGLVCKDFEEQVLWSSNYSLFSEGSTGYYVWNPKFSCSELNVDNCFFSNITLQTRFIFTDLEEGITEGEGYVQISNPKESICAEPEKVKYSDYLAYEILSEEEIKLGRYCGNNKNSNNKCGIEKLNRYNFLNCYGIKVYGSQYLITDVLIINLFLSLITFSSIFAGKSDQFFSGNLTCEIFVDNIVWSVAGTKLNPNAHTYLNWTPGTACTPNPTTVGPKNCDIKSIGTFVRFINVGVTDSDGLCNQALTQIANRTESPLGSGGDWTNIRFSSCDNTIIAGGATLGPQWDCANYKAKNVCNVANSGFNDSFANYSVHLNAIFLNAKEAFVVDNFNINYSWCWTPIIFNANISKESGAWGSNFTFRINVTNPTANTTIKLWRRLAGQEWQQIGEEKYCNNCASTDLNWTINFNCTDIGDWEFKFNATDNAGYNTTAWASGITNECMDQDNDCIFSILKDDVNITHISGNQSTATSEIPAEFHLRAYDLSKGSYDISEILNVKFDVTNIGDIFQTVGNNNTNSSGNVLFYFNPSGFTSGTKKWKGYLDLSSCYNSYTSQNYSVSVSVNAAPTGTNEVVNGVTSGAIAGWGEVWNFSVNASDSDGDLFNVTLRINTGLGFVDVETKSCISDCSTLTKYNFNISNFLCANVTSSAQYKFYLIDSNLISSETTARTFQIEKDDILFENIFGNNTIANRTGNQTDLFIFRVKDLDNGNYIDSGKNVTFKKNNPVLFYLFQRYKLENSVCVPSSAGWGYSNRNFIVIAISGNINQ